MAKKWNSTKYPGVRYREHPTRKHGVKKDRYFAIRHQVKGKRKEEGLGWSSEGWTVHKASITLAELKKGYVTGEGPTRLSEKRKLAKEKKTKDKAERKQQKAEALTYGRFFEDTYFPHAKVNKSKKSWDREEQFYRLWVSPILAEKPLKKISPLDLERIKSNMSKAGRAPRTIHYCLAVIRQVFNTAKMLGLYEGDNPVSKVKKPKVDNKRLRFLNKDEADRLLADLKFRSRQLHDMALISLHGGLRADEIFKLTWSDVDIERGIMMLRDTKGGPSRPAFMTERVKDVFRSIKLKSPSDLVFTNRKGEIIKEISNAFGRAVKDLGLNDGVEDKRYKVVFHSLRHTFASWLVEDGTDLYAVQKLMGHSTISMTERYAHLSNGTLQNAVKKLEKSLNIKPDHINLKGYSDGNSPELA